MNMTFGQQQPSEFFNTIIDVALIVTTIISTLVSLSVPCLYYLKKQCQEHPTVLIANISLLEAVANFNVLLMAYSLYEYESNVNINQIFHTITFNLIHFSTLQSQQETDFCIYNFTIYMLLQLVSISFHICYSVDLFLTIQFPFLSGKKRRKFYYLFAVLFPIMPMINSVTEAADICVNDLQKQSIYIVPFPFLITLVIFCGISITIIILSFTHSKSRSKIRSDYINHHRIILGLLVLLWICPIWINFMILFNRTQGMLFRIVNIAAFFCIVSSSGIINAVRLSFDNYLRKRVKAMMTLQRQDRQSITSVSSVTYVELATGKQQTILNEVWNLPLSGAMNELQSQQIVHNIIQVVTQACAAFRPKQTRMSEGFQGDRISLYESIYRNTIVIESQSQIMQKSLLDLFKKRREMKYSVIDPNQCNIQQLKELCKKKRRFNMSCVTSSKVENDNDRLKQKTVHITSNLAKSQQPPNEIQIVIQIKVTSYSHRVFESLRNNDGLTIDQIIKTLDLEKNINSIKKAKESMGASGSFFFFSFDHKIVIKTISEEQKDRLIELMPYYYDHIRYNENSLLSRIYGVFSIEIAGISKIYFIMMENTFQSLQNNSISYNIYDLKGSTVKRQVKDPSATVLKDINYFNSPDCFIFMSRENKIRLIDQITKDIDMLKNHNIMDYSLLLGVGKSKQRKSRKKLMEEGIKQNLVDQFRYVTELEELTKRVYSISIIDYLQEFNFSKKMQLWLKRIFKGGGDISSIGTKEYHSRFLDFLNRVIVVFNIKFQDSRSKTKTKA